jgi:uncharacterized membrane protein/protein-disulfide isomerase
MTPGAIGWDRSRAKRFPDASVPGDVGLRSVPVAHDETSRSWPWWRWALTGLSALGLVLSVYLAWHYLAGGAVIGCGGGSPCEKILNSRWSAIGGVLPVSGLAMGVYLAMLIANFFIGPSAEASVRRLAWCAMLVLGGAIAGSAMWFVIVQRWIIGSFCPYCMAAHITGLLLAVLVIWRTMRFDDDSHRVIRPLSAVRYALIGLGLAAIMAGSQAAFTPAAVYRSGESRENLLAIDPHTAPLVGSPDAPHVLTLLFDYKCPHCQQLHFMLDEVIRRYDGKLAFVLCPTPLNTRCNPYVPRDVDEFADSCELAKVALAVWVAKREAFPAFNRWMFSMESGDRWQPRSLDAAKGKAIELVGAAKFDAASADSWIGQYLQTCIRVYGNTIQDNNNAVPKLVFGSHWVIPKPNDADDLILILQDSLGVPKP